MKKFNSTTLVILGVMGVLLMVFSMMQGNNSDYQIPFDEYETSGTFEEPSYGDTQSVYNADQKAESNKGTYWILMLGFAMLLSPVGLYFLLIKLYCKKATPDFAFVRTGLGGIRCVLDGALIVLPMIHDVVWVPLSTIKVDIRREMSEGLITKDHFRADAHVEFYVRIMKDIDDVSTAAHSFISSGIVNGKERMIKDESIGRLIETRLISELRTVAAVHGFEYLLHNSNQITDDLEALLLNSLHKLGLTLDGITISKFELTDELYLNPDNIFDAQGLKKMKKMREEAAKDEDTGAEKNESAG